MNTEEVNVAMGHNIWSTINLCRSVIDARVRLHIQCPPNVTELEQKLAPRWATRNGLWITVHATSKKTPGLPGVKPPEAATPPTCYFGSESDTEHRTVELDTLSRPWEGGGLDIQREGLKTVQGIVQMVSCDLLLCQPERITACSRQAGRQYCTGK